VKFKKKYFILPSTKWQNNNRINRVYNINFNIFKNIQIGS